MPNSIFRVSAKALVFDDQGRLLLLKESDGRWEIPGGGIDDNESPRETIVREIHEECGLAARVLDEQPTAVWSVSHNDQFDFLYLGYRTAVDDIAGFVPSEECVELKYIALADARALPACPSLKGYLSNLQ
ncbi:MAG: NUDIX hydrolase [Patescibacteria group bacterium]|jgi:8-oxo-dGTP diphosphatase